MSFSFNFTANTKAQAKARITEEMSKVVAQYGIEHSHDAHAAIAAGHAYIDVLADDPGKGISVQMYGSLGYQMPTVPDGALHISSAGVSVSATHTAQVQ